MEEARFARNLGMPEEVSPGLARGREHCAQSPDWSRLLFLSTAMTVDKGVPR